MLKLTQEETFMKSNNMFGLDLLVNEKLVEEGLARVSVLHGTAFKYASRLYEAEKKAREQKKGIWVEK